MKEYHYTTSTHLKYITKYQILDTVNFIESTTPCVMNNMPT